MQKSDPTLSHVERLQQLSIMAKWFDVTQSSNKSLAVPPSSKVLNDLMSDLASEDTLIAFAAKSTSLSLFLTAPASTRACMLTALSCASERLASHAGPVELLRAILHAAPDSAELLCAPEGPVRALWAQPLPQAELVRYQRMRLMRLLARGPGPLQAPWRSWLAHASAPLLASTSASAGQVEWVGMERARTDLLQALLRGTPQPPLAAALEHLLQYDPQRESTALSAWGRSQTTRRPVEAALLLGELLLRALGADVAAATEVLLRLWQRRETLAAASSAWHQLWALADDELLVRATRLLLDVHVTAARWAHLQTPLQPDAALACSFAEQWAGAAAADVLTRLLSAEGGAVAGALLHTRECGVALLETLLVVLKGQAPLPAPPAPLAPDALAQALRALRVRLLHTRTLPFEPHALCVRIERFLVAHDHGSSDTRTENTARVKS